MSTPTKIVNQQFYVETEYGCTIVRALTIENAQRYILREYGRQYFKSIQPATQSQIDWVTRMGGRIHDLLPAKPKKEAPA